MAEIIINTKEVIKRKSYYPDFINIIINSKEFIIPTYKESASVDDIDNIQFDCSINRDMCTAVISYIDSNIQTYCYFKKYDEFLGIIVSMTVNSNKWTFSEKNLNPANPSTK